MVGDNRVILGKVIVLFPNTRKARYFIQALERKYSISAEKSANSKKLIEI